MSEVKLSDDEQEKKWQREDDARTLANAAEIGNDKERLEAAQKAAKDMLEEEQSRAEAMKAVAAGNLVYPKTDFEK